MKTKHSILSVLFTCVFIACDGITPVVPDDGTRYGEFNLSITYEANGLTVQFSPKHDYSGDLWYEWDFGDGTKSTQKQPTNTYSKNESEVVKLYFLHFFNIYNIILIQKITTRCYFTILFVLYILVCEQSKMHNNLKKY